MAMLQLIIRKYSRRITRLLPVNCIRFFDTGLDPTRPAQDGEFCDPTRPDPPQPVCGPDPCPTLGVCFYVQTDDFGLTLPLTVTM